MKKINYIYLLAITASSFMISCSDDFQNIIPSSEVSGESVWKDDGLSTAAVTDIYKGLGVGGLGEQMLSSLSDESLFTHTGRGINTVNESRTNSNDTGWIDSTHEWNNMFKYIRSANIAILKLNEGTLENTKLRDRLLGEALFLRAYYYHQLIRFYGGVPIVDKPFELDSDFQAPRNSYEDCVNFITKDCDAAFTLLNGKRMDDGRTNAAAALALKARVLTYAASDLHDIPTAKANSPLIGSYASPELLGYIGGDQKQRWTAALNASKAALDYINGGYKFGLSAPATFDEAKQNYMNIALSRNGGERDVIFQRQYISTSGQNVGLFNGPNGYHNWAGNTPLQNFVDHYNMKDGSKFDWSNSVQSSAPYKDREPRFYATVLYDGADWKPRPSDVADRDPANQIQSGQYEIVNGLGSIIKIFGLDTRQGPVEDWNGSRTGYYFRKFTNPDPAFSDQNMTQTIPWPFIRYTEVALDYVEALLETENEGEAKIWLNQIRFRAGLPAVTVSGTALVDVYRNERLLELAFEEHRYHDARRWMIAPSTLGAPAKIIQITAKLKPGATVTKYKYDTNNYTYTYIPTTVDPGFENRLWLDKSYFLPIRINELNSDTNLKQNPGYE
ncbi:RagB/SusD family nutrient uptake outer membrane protein [Flavobacterium sp. ZS1P14]|uniref:RagB/SusD family nutrient uptake outer membrane protein n=1 Tax=Flavobacterium sp. ZS1P14 TaxID=3401729 RepID=UPI003AAFF515